MIVLFDLSQTNPTLKCKISCFLPLIFIKNFGITISYLKKFELITIQLKLHQTNKYAYSHQS